MTRGPTAVLTLATMASTLRTVALPLILGIALAIAARGAVRIYSIPSASMQPTLLPGDHILVVPYHRSLPHRGDVVVFHNPADPDELFVKRIVAGPGDLVTSGAGRLIIRGHTIAEPYVLDPVTTGEIPPQIVPADSYYVLGDNRADSLDSRSWGVLPRTLIVGRARLVLWSSAIAPSEQTANAAPAAENANDPRSFRFARLFHPIL